MFTVTPIAHVRSPRTSLADDFWGAVESEIELTADFAAESLAGLEGFSHVEIVYLFDRVDPRDVVTAARHPRGRADWPLVGIFAQRGKARPNRLGVSRAVILAIAGNVLRVRGLDAVDGTPVLDIKPWMEEFGPLGPTRQPEWASALMANYYKP